MSDALERLIAESEQPLSGPAARFVDGLVSGNTEIRAARVLVPRDVLSREKVVFAFETARGALELPYSPRLNEALIRLGVGMTEPDSEAIRIGKLLLDNLRYPDAQFGRHYTDAVLWEVLNERFGNVEGIRRRLDGITHYSPSGDSRHSCEVYLRQCLEGAGNTLVLTFGWGQAHAAKILSGAVYYVLDMRHHISAREALFPRYERPTSENPSTRHDDHVDGMIPGLWLGPREQVPAKPTTLISAVLPRRDVAVSAATSLTCLDLVRVDAVVRHPGKWAWLVLSEAAVYTYVHTIGLMQNEKWRFVRWDRDRPIQYIASFERPLSPDVIAGAYGDEAFNRSRQDRNAVQLRLQQLAT